MTAQRGGQDYPQQSTYISETVNEPAGLATARTGVAHIEHHGRPLRFAGSSYMRDTIEHRFKCQDRACHFLLVWTVTT